MSSFPLYDILMSNLPNKDLTVIQKRDFVEKISELDTDGIELIFALIKYYSVDKDIGKGKIPFNGTIDKNQVEFDLLEFPTQLRQLLYKFVLMHLKKIQEDRDMQKLSTISLPEQSV